MTQGQFIMNIETIPKVVSLGEDELSEYDLKVFKEYNNETLKADALIYDYNNEGYEGSGIAVWKREDDWYYLDLGHCSCYGPTSEISSADLVSFTLPQIKSILSKEDYSSQSKNVLKYLESNY